MLKQVDLKREEAAKPCAICSEPSIGEVWSVPLCADHTHGIMATELLTAGSIEAQVPTKPWSKESLALADREPLLERYRREFDAEAKKRTTRWVGEQRKAAA